MKVPANMAGEALEKALADILDPKIDTGANLIDGGRRDTSVDWGQAGYDTAIGAALSALGQGGRAAFNSARGDVRENARSILDYSKGTELLISRFQALQIMDEDARIKVSSNLPKRVYMPDTTINMTIGELNNFGLTGVVPSGVSATNVYAMAGAGTSVVIRDWQRLYAEKGGDPSQWMKMSGDVRTDYHRYIIHWYERDGVQIDGKIKDVK